MENEWSIYYRDLITKFLKYNDLINFLFFIFLQVFST